MPVVIDENRTGSPYSNLLHWVFRMATAGSSTPSISTTPPAAAAPAAAATASKGMAGGFLDYIAGVQRLLYLLIDTKLLTLAPELGHLAPIILTFGAAFFALVSFNYPLAVFAASGAEASIIYSLFSAAGDLLAYPTAQASPDRCSSTFETLTPARFSMLLRGKPFPNSPLYFLSFAASYLIQSMFYYSEELTAMGPQYSSRPFIAAIGAAMLLLLYSAYVLAFGCEGLMSIAASVLLGLFVGYLISSQNLLLLGKPSISVLFVPPLVNNPNMDYLCVKA